MKSILAAVVLGASLWTQSANAQLDVCRAVIQPGVVSGEHEVLRAGDTYRMQLTLGAGTITGSPIPPGPSIVIHAVRFVRDCHSIGTLTPVRCTEAGNVVAYLGDETITTDCPGVAWSTGQSAGTGSSVIKFVPSAPLQVPGSVENFCQLEFDLQVIKKKSPIIHEIAAYGLGDLECNNGLNATDIQEIGVHVE